MKNLFSIEGKVALVTGGSRGIGAMIAQGLVENGVKTYITARNAEELQATAKTLSALGECIAIPADLSTMEGVSALAEVINAQEKAVHILVNNAGTNWEAKIDEFPESGWDKAFNLNVKSMFFLTQKLLPALRNAGTDIDPARVLNIGSIHGILNPGASTYSYSSSKAAVHHLTKHLGSELTQQHVNVNAIAPGLFPSKMTASLLPFEKEMAEKIPAKRLGNPEDIAGTVIYLCSRASAYVTGHTLVLDGGMVSES